MGSATDTLMGKVKSAARTLAGDGVSVQTKKALRDAGESMDQETVDNINGSADAMDAGRGGPSPSADLLKRVEAERQRKSAESLKRVMENRRKAGQ